MFIIRSLFPRTLYYTICNTRNGCVVGTWQPASAEREMWTRWLSSVRGHGKLEFLSHFTLQTLLLGFCVFPTKRRTTDRINNVGHRIEFVKGSDRRCSGHRNGPPLSYTVSSISIVIQIFLWTPRLKCNPRRSSDDRLRSLSRQVP